MSWRAAKRTEAQRAELQTYYRTHVAPELAHEAAERMGAALWG